MKKTSKQLLLYSVLIIMIIFAFRLRVNMNSSNKKQQFETHEVNAMEIGLRAADEPTKVDFLAPALFETGSAEAACAKSLFSRPPDGPLNVSYACHLLRVYQFDGINHAAFASGREVTRALTEETISEKIFKTNILVQTRDGIRYKDIHVYSNSQGENHRDLVLATFAELGIPLSTTVLLKNGKFSLRDLMLDSIKNFDIKQSELPWSAIAYTLYLSSQKKWTNRFGESFDFDNLADALMAIPLEGSSCGGSHVLYSLTILQRVNFSNTCLSLETAKAVSSHLEKMVERATRSQHRDGFWTLDWSGITDAKDAKRVLSQSKALQGQLIATGHLLEWLEILPKNLQPRDAVYRDAARWLLATEKGGFLVTNSESFCAHFHALNAVSKLVKQ